MASPTDHLANERTFLAWLRTGISLIGLGFVIARFGLFLKQLAQSVPLAHPRSTEFSAIVGIAMVALGGVVNVAAAWRYQRNRRALDAGRLMAGGMFIWVLAVLLGIAAAGLIGYLIDRAA